MEMAETIHTLFGSRFTRYGTSFYTRIMFGRFVSGRPVINLESTSEDKHHLGLIFAISGCCRKITDVFATAADGQSRSKMRTGLDRNAGGHAFQPRIQQYL